MREKEHLIIPRLVLWDWALRAPMILEGGGARCSYFRTHLAPPGAGTGSRVSGRGPWARGFAGSGLEEVAIFLGQKHIMFC